MLALLVCVATFCLAEAAQCELNYNFHDPGYKMYRGAVIQECRRDGDFHFWGCRHQGVDHKSGTTWISNHYRYECYCEVVGTGVDKKNHFGTKIHGCVMDSGTYVEFGVPKKDEAGRTCRCDDLGNGQVS